MGKFLQIIGWVIAAVFGLNVFLTFPSVESALHQSVLWLMIIASTSGLALAGIGTLIRRLTELRDQLSQPIASPAAKTVATASN